ncbi:MAG TPA: hypothetical protein VIJ51_05260 [Solirubrobacteraceae bacterium]
MRRMRIRRTTIFGAGAAVVLLVLSSTTGAIGASAGPGVLRQLPKALGCWVFKPADGCSVYSAPRELSHFATPSIVSTALSSDGRNLYVAANAGTNLIVAFGRAADGSLVPVKGPTGCILPLTSACEPPVYRQRQLSGLALSPDGRNLYSIADYRPVEAVQAVVRLSGGGLRGAAPGVSCGSAKGVDAADRRHHCQYSVELGAGPRALAVSPDGHEIYVAVGDRVVTLGRTPTGGVFLAACLGPPAPALRGIPCEAARATTQASGIALSPDGRYAYVASADGLAVAARNPRTGSLTQLAGPAGCVDATGAGGCTVGRAVSRSTDPTRSGGSRVAISRDGRNVYLAAADGIASFARDASTGDVTQLAGPAGCITQTAGDGCAIGRSLAGIEGLKVSPDGLSVYAAAYSSRGLAILTRASTGALVQPAGPTGCVNADASSGCAAGRAIGEADTVSVSPDSHSVYVGSLDAGLAIFRRG